MTAPQSDDKDGSGRCPHCGADVMARCIPPYDYTKCSFYKAKANGPESLSGGKPEPLSDAAKARNGAAPASTEPTPTFDAESALAGIADCINLGIRENGRWDDQIRGIKEDMRPFVNRLIDYVREKERAPLPELRDSNMDADTSDAARVYPIARPVREHVGYILDAENRQIGRASPEYAVQIVHALNATASTSGTNWREWRPEPADIANMKVDDALIRLGQVAYERDLLLARINAVSAIGTPKP